MEWLSDRTGPFLETAAAYVVSAAFYGQVVAVLVALLLAAIVGAVVSQPRELIPLGIDNPVVDEIRRIWRTLRNLAPQALAIVLLGVAQAVCADVLKSVWLVRIAEGVALLVLLYGFTRHFVTNKTFAFLLKWIALPLVFLYMAGWLDETITYLDGFSVKAGNLNISLYDALRTAVFGVILFWLGRKSNATGQRVIQTQATLDVGARQIISKLFEIAVYAIIILILLNVMGIDLTALTVFGGALGVGIGVGLQPIASNFISGLIILFDRSISVGDYIQLEDGRTGVLRELTIRSARLETFDGKEIMVPNDRFVTTAFINWTHQNDKQRYELRFQVAYQTDLEALFPLIIATMKSHPQVLSGPDLPAAEQPDAEIEKFNESGVGVLAKYWMHGVDDGENRVTADLLLMIWSTLKANDIEMPFPQREVTLRKARK